MVMNKTHLKKYVFPKDISENLLKLEIANLLIACLVGGLEHERGRSTTNQHIYIYIIIGHMNHNNHIINNTN